MKFSYSGKTNADDVTLTRSDVDEERLTTMDGMAASYVILGNEITYLTHLHDMGVGNNTASSVTVTTEAIDKFVLGTIQCPQCFFSIYK